MRPPPGLEGSDLSKVQGDPHWAAYLPPQPDITRYDPGATVVDVGCGVGTQLTRLRAAGFRAIGVELSRAQARASKKVAHPVIVARAESLPIRSGGCQGILCKVVIPYTDERVAIREIGRVLAEDGVAVLYLHGIGYSLRYLLRPDTLKHCLYGAKTIANTVVYRVTGRRLPGALGDTLLQSESRLRSYYRPIGLQVEAVTASKRFLGLPVFIGHVLRKRGK